MQEKQEEQQVDFGVDFQVLEMVIPFSLTQTQTQEEVSQVEVCLCLEEFIPVSFKYLTFSDLLLNFY